MKMKTYWKEVGRSISQSKGRFLSIFLLLALASFAYTGLKVTSPNMNRAANDYLDARNTQDLLVTHPLGLTKEDEERLGSLKGANVDFGRSLDVDLDGKALRIYSQAKEISRFDLVQGRLPEKKNEIVLDSGQIKQHPIGSEIGVLTSKESPLTETKFTVVGYVESADILSKSNMGDASTGSGMLESYGVVADAAFKEGLSSFARISYKDLRGKDAFGSAYTEGLVAHQEELDSVLKDMQKSRQASVVKEAEERLNQERTKLTQAEADLKGAKQALEAARGLMPAEALAQKEGQIKESEASLASGKEQLAQKEKDVKEIEVPAYRSLDRVSVQGGQGYMILSNSMGAISGVGDVFPFVLYGVAALVTLTTMTRFVDEERIKAGTLRALGYEKAAILKKFLIYGFLAAAGGTMLGVWGGHVLLSPMVADIILKESLAGPAPTHFYASFSLWALLFSLLAALLPAFLVARKELEEAPASLLLPKPPAAGSRILLERLSFIWKRLSFTHKVTARNIFRYKQRMLMTIIGVAGSMALLFTGLGLQSSISGVADRQFEELLQYQILTVQDSDQASQDFKKILDSDQVASWTQLGTDLLYVEPQKGQKKQTVSLMVLEADQVSNYVQLLDAEGTPLELGHGLILSQKLASLYGVKKGDWITLDGHRLQVGGVTEGYAGHFFYLTPKEYKDVFGKTLKPTSYLIKMKKSSNADIKEMAEKILALDSTQALSQNVSMKQSFEETAKSLQSVMGILVLVSILLAVVILYNLTNINVSERIRELSTIKVLGFYTKEVMLYIYRETILLSLIGLGLGLTAGFYLHRALLEVISSDSIRFNPAIASRVYLIPILVLVILLFLLALVVARRLKKVDMLEALKSVE